jgi:RNA polymerase sigma factor (sigma-70 family)
LVQRYSGMVFSACKRVLEDSVLAEDVTQECFIELMRSRKRIRASLGGWLHTMATHRSIDRIKGDARRRDGEASFAEGQPTSLESDVETSEVLAHVDKAIAALPEKFRLVVVARFLDGQAHTSIASDLGVAEATVRYRVSQGVQQIRQDLKGRGIAVGAAALTAALATTAEAAPAALTADLRKLALSGNVPVVVGVGLSMGLAVKLTSSVAIVVAVLTGFWALKSHDDTGGSAAKIPGELPPEVRSLVDESGGGAPTSEPTVPVSASGSGLALTEEAPEAVDALIQGRVYDIDTGLGIAGVRLRVSPTGGGPLTQGEKPTEADGRYTFTGLSDGAYDVSPEDVDAYPDPRGSQRISIIIKDSQPVTNVDLALKKGIAVAGTVVDNRGTTVAAVVVGAKSARVPNPLKAKSDGKGHFVIYMPEATDNLMIQAQNEAFESVTHTNLTLPEEGLDSVVLTLSHARSASISGVVVDGTGVGVKGAQVRLHHKVTRVFQYGHQGVADDQGRFRIANCEAGNYAIIVTPAGVNGYSTAEEYENITLAAGEHQKDIEIIFGEKGGLAIAGRVPH